MSNSLRVYSSVLRSIRHMLGDVRKTRQANLARMVTGLHLGKHVHLSEIANHLPGLAKLLSKVRQLRRFVANEAVKARSWYKPFAKKVINAAASSGRLRLLIDTTELPGTRQILMVALAYRRRAIPLIWKVLRRTGVTDVKTHCKLLKALASWLPDQAEIILIGDGEFHGVDLMAWLEEQQWHFRLRMHKDTWIRLASGRWAQLQELEIEKGGRRYFQNVLLTRDKRYGPVNLAVTWDSEEDEPWYIATDQEADYYTLLDYSRRMWIEEMIGDFKDGHFHLHKSRLWKPERLSRLLLALCIVYTWMMHLGAYVIKRGWRHFVDRADRRDRSLPSIGLLWLQRCLNTGERIHIDFKPYY